MFGDKSSQSLRINGDTMPLDSGTIGIIPRVLVLERPPVVANPTGTDGEKSDDGATLERLLERYLPRLPNQYGLHNKHNYN